jgi:hypothetical protein
LRPWAAAVRPHSRLQCRLLSLHGQQRRGDCSELELFFA